MAVLRDDKIVNGKDLKEFGKGIKEYHDRNTNGETLTTDEVNDICVEVFNIIIADKTEITLSLSGTNTDTITTNPTGCTFTSLDDTKATVDSSTGVVTGVAEGETEIKISKSGLSDTYVTVKIEA